MCRQVVHIVKAMVFPVLMWELDHKEGWAPHNWCFQTVVLEKTLESPLDCKEIEPVNPKGHQPWIFIGRTDAEAETPILLPLDVKSWVTGKDPDAVKDWRQKEEWAEDEMVRYHHRLNGHGFEQTQSSLVAQLVKNLPAMQETLVQPLGQEDPLEKGQATHSSILGLP